MTSSLQAQLLSTDKNGLHFNKDNPLLTKMLVDQSYYPAVHSLITRSENSSGDYDYSSVTNFGMIYLFIHQRGSNRKSNTKKEYVRELMQFIQYISDHGNDDIRTLKRSQLEEYQEWIADRYPKLKTQAKKITILNSFLSWCHAENYLEKDLSRGLVGVKLIRNQIPDREISDDSLQHAIEYYAHDPKFQSLMLILATTGLRLREVITPEWKDLYFDSARKKYYLRTRTKRDGVRHAQIKEYVLEVLNEYRRRLGLGTQLNVNDDSPFYPNRSGKHYSLTSLSAIVTKKLEAAKLRTLQNQKSTAHGFRHFYARKAFLGGASTDRIAKTLDHSSSKVTEQNYLHRELKKEVDVTDFVEIAGFEGKR